jgi:hypothetical protein
MAKMTMREAVSETMNMLKRPKKILKLSILTVFVIIIISIIMWGHQDIRWLTFFYLVFVSFFIYSFTNGVTLD